jgi:hypothetical protein
LADQHHGRHSRGKQDGFDVDCLAALKTKKAVYWLTNPT